MTDKEEMKEENEEVLNQGEEQTQESNSAEDSTKEFGEAEPMDPVDKLQLELQDEKNKYLRLYAEFENFRRRSAKERIELINTASADLMKEILPVLDDFGRAIEVNQTSEDLKAVKEGFELLHTKLEKLLGNKGLEGIDSKGEDFDPEVHEAIAQIPAENKKQKGKVIDVVERGYKLGDKIIRHPKVVVGT